MALHSSWILSSIHIRSTCGGKGGNDAKWRLLLTSSSSAHLYRALACTIRGNWELILKHCSVTTIILRITHISGLMNYTLFEPKTSDQSLWKLNLPEFRPLIPHWSHSFFFAHKSSKVFSDSENNDDAAFVAKHLSGCLSSRPPTERVDFDGACKRSGATRWTPLNYWSLLDLLLHALAAVLRRLVMARARPTRTGRRSVHYVVTWRTLSIIHPARAAAAPPETGSCYACRSSNHIEPAKQFPDFPCDQTMLLDSNMTWHLQKDNRVPWPDRWMHSDKSKNFKRVTSGPRLICIAHPAVETVERVVRTG